MHPSGKQGKTKIGRGRSYLRKTQGKVDGLMRPREKEKRMPPSEEEVSHGLQGMKECWRSSSRGEQISTELGPMGEEKRGTHRGGTGQ